MYAKPFLAFAVFIHFIFPLASAAIKMKNTRTEGVGLDRGQ